MTEPDKSVIEDALSVCSEIIKLQSQNAELHEYIRIAQENANSFISNTPLIDVVYKYVETPFYLEKNGLLKIDGSKWLDGLTPMPRGYYWVIPDKDKIQRWFKNNMSIRLGGTPVIEFPPGKDYAYQDMTLYLKKKGGGNYAFNMSKMDNLRPVFEAFYFLYDKTNKPIVTVNEVMSSYKKRNETVIDWKTLVKRKSSIMKYINGNSIMKNRIKWGCISRQGDEWEFVI